MQVITFAFDPFAFGCVLFPFLLRVLALVVAVAAILDWKVF